MGDAVDEVRDQLESVTDADLAGWVKDYYDQICQACDDRNIPRPPPWRDVP